MPIFHPFTSKRPYGASVAGEPTYVRFCAPDEVRRVFIVLRQEFCVDGEAGEPLRLELDPLDSGEFALSFTLPSAGIWKYRFEGELENGDLAFYGRGTDGYAIRGDWLPEWQLTVQKCARKVPNWAKQGVIYQIFADRFCRTGETPFDKEGRLHVYWNDRPDIAEPDKEYRADDFFGGNAMGIISRLDYLCSLGVSCIYLSPVFESSSNHRYDVADYLKIDSLFGSEEEFRLLIQEANRRGINIMLDGVFNHTGADSVYFNKYGNYPSLGAYQSKQSPYFDWYYFSDYPVGYHCWWGSTVVPTVNKSAQGFRELILGEGGVIDKWSSMGVKGWRLDVVDELPSDFTTALCRRIRDFGEDMFVVGEVWEDATVKIAYGQWRPYFMGEQLDSVMNYPFKDAILAYARGGDAAAFAEAVTLVAEHYPFDNLCALMNLVGSHDTVRAITALSGASPATKRERAEFKLSDEQYATARKRLMLASTLQYLLPGVPCLYYGDEAGMQGFEDPLNRGTYPWGSEDETLIAHYARLGEIRGRYADVLQGKLLFAKHASLLIFARASEKGVLIIIANSADRDVRVETEEFLPSLLKECSELLDRKVCAEGLKDVFSGKTVTKRFTVPEVGARVFLVIPRG